MILRERRDFSNQQLSPTDFSKPEQGVEKSDAGILIQDALSPLHTGLEKTQKVKAVDTSGSRVQQGSGLIQA